jgi:hypothetical protein
MRFACRINEARIPTHNNNIYYLLVFHGNNVHANAKCAAVHTVNNPTCCLERFSKRIKGWGWRLAHSPGLNPYDGFLLACN